MKHQPKSEFFPTPHTHSFCFLLTSLDAHGRDVWWPNHPLEIKKILPDGDGQKKKKQKMSPNGTSTNTTQPKEKQNVLDVRSQNEARRSCTWRLLTVTATGNRLTRHRWLTPPKTKHSKNGFQRCNPNVEGEPSNKGGRASLGVNSLSRWLHLLFSFRQPIEMRLMFP